MRHSSTSVKSLRWAMKEPLVCHIPVACSQCHWSAWNDGFKKNRQKCVELTVHQTGPPLGILCSTVHPAHTPKRSSSSQGRFFTEVQGARMCGVAPCALGFICSFWSRQHFDKKAPADTIRSTSAKAKAAFDF